MYLNALGNVFLPNIEINVSLNLKVICSYMLNGTGSPNGIISIPFWGVLE
jgi:hypothetical protein